MSYVKKTHRFGLLTPVVQHDPGAGILGGLAADRFPSYRTRGLSRHHP